MEKRNDVRKEREGEGSTARLEARTVSSKDRAGKCSNADVKNARCERFVLWNQLAYFLCCCERAGRTLVSQK